jgi:cobalt-zinc-cadmium efflux system outer membrane protein
LHTMAKRAYYGRAVLERKLRAIAETDSLLSFVIATATERYPSGKEAIENIYKAKAAKAELGAMRTMIRSDIYMKNVELLNLLNLGYTEFEIDTVLPAIKNTDLNVYMLSAVDADSFPSVRAIDASIRMMQAKREYEHSALYPEFGVSVNHMQALNAMMPNQFSVMGMVSIPIAPWSRTETDAMTGGIDQEIESMRQKRLAVIREQETNERIYASQRQAIRSQLNDIDEKVLPEYRRSFEAALGSYAQNAGDLFRVVDAWQMLRMAEMNRLEVLQSLVNAEILYEEVLETN